VACRIDGNAGGVVKSSARANAIRKHSRAVPRQGSHNHLSTAAPQQRHREKRAQRHTTVPRGRISKAATRASGHCEFNCELERFRLRDG
jgi:hypothetical protein